MKSFGSPAASRAGERLMDERCSSYVDFAVNGDDEWTTAFELQRCTRKERKRERKEKERERERKSEEHAKPRIREDERRSCSYTAVNWTTSRIRMTNDCRPLTKSCDRREEHAENTRDVGSFALKSRAVSSAWCVATFQRLADVTFNGESRYLVRIVVRGSYFFFFYNNRLEKIIVRMKRGSERRYSYQILIIVSIT